MPHHQPELICTSYITENDKTHPREFDTTKEEVGETINREEC